MDCANLPCDLFYIQMNLYPETEFPTDRRTLGRFFRRLRRKQPMLRHPRRTGPREWLIDMEVQRGGQWCQVGRGRIGGGVLMPSSEREMLEMNIEILLAATRILELRPVHCASMEIVLAFEFLCHGNQPELLVSALGLPPAMETFCPYDGRVLHYMPTLTFAMQDDPRTQIRLHFETTSPVFGRSTLPFSTEVGVDQNLLTVFLTLRRYLRDADGNSECGFRSVLERLFRTACERVGDTLPDSVLRPLAERIAICETFFDPDADNP